MKTFIFTLVFLFHFLLPIKSSEFVIKNNFFVEEIIEKSEFGELYIDKGTANKKLSDNASISVKVMIYKKKLTSITQKSFRRHDGDIVYRYSIVCVSNSKYNNQLTSTWLYGFWVKINNVLITKPIYPKGKDVMIYTTPTVAHYVETDEEEIKVNVGWIESIPDPKIIK